ncbi:hypothetical protein EON66_09125 [archaeon]|nr:MAG: hypothetical protein EON66_09125 [archaeon]
MWPTCQACVPHVTAVASLLAPLLAGCPCAERLNAQHPRVLVSRHRSMPRYSSAAAAAVRDAASPAKTGHAAGAGGSSSKGARQGRGSGGKGRSAGNDVTTVVLDFMPEVSLTRSFPATKTSAPLVPRAASRPVSGRSDARGQHLAPLFEHQFRYRHESSAVAPTRSCVYACCCTMSADSVALVQSMPETVALAMGLAALASHFKLRPIALHQLEVHERPPLLIAAHVWRTLTLACAS